MNEERFLKRIIIDNQDKKLPPNLAIRHVRQRYSQDGFFVIKFDGNQKNGNRIITDPARVN